MKTLILILMLALSPMAFTGCKTTAGKPTPQAVLFYTLSDTKTLVDAAEKVYGNEVVLGRVSKEKQAKIDALIREFHHDFGVAVVLARKDWTSITPDDVSALADILIQNLLKP